jgi:muramoyltetrapeptide carboxypeptidase LdcA involved in peptidoglycan recycling
MPDVVEFVVLEFASETPGAQFAGQLKRLAAAGTLEIVDALVVGRSASGMMHLIESDELPVRAAESLIAEADVDDIVAELPAGHAAALLILAHSWLVGAGVALHDTGGRVVLVERLPSSLAASVLARR